MPSNGHSPHDIYVSQDFPPPPLTTVTAEPFMDRTTPSEYNGLYVTTTEGEFLATPPRPPYPEEYGRRPYQSQELGHLV